MPNSKPSLLIVDDEAPIRSLVSQVLATKGMDVRTAEDGFDALRQIQQATPDLILSDLNMPGMSGFELLSVVRRRLPQVYVVATSGVFAGPDVPAGVAADAFYEKASGVGKLLRLVDLAVEANFTPQRAETPAAPIWVGLGDRTTPSMELALNCPECLRNSAMAEPEPERIVHETHCTSCGALIRYAVIRPIAAVSAPAEQVPVPSVA